MPAKNYYLIKFQYLGFRYHGWLRQSNARTVQEMIEKTLVYVLGETKFKILGASRTDSKVSANEAAFELFVWKPLDELTFLEAFNRNLPFDIRALSIQAVDEKFNVIQDSKLKEYLYLFSFGAKNHPFCAPMMAYLYDDLDIKLMQNGARLFEGIHNFSSYCTKPAENTQFERELLVSEIVPNEQFTASFFPDESFLFRVCGSGFLRYQVRWMMGALFSLGKREITLEEIQESLSNNINEPIGMLAPASGLILNAISYE